MVGHKKHEATYGIIWKNNEYYVRNTRFSRIPSRSFLLFISF